MALNIQHIEDWLGRLTNLSQAFEYSNAEKKVFPCRSRGQVHLLKTDDVGNWETNVVVLVGMSPTSSALEHLAPS